jgi:hypothetical protein
MCTKNRGKARRELMAIRSRSLRSMMRELELRTHSQELMPLRSDEKFEAERKKRKQAKQATKEKT